VAEEGVAQSVVCGPNPERHLSQIRAFLDAGYDHVYAQHILPQLR
jgi:hypothetical protein